MIITAGRAGRATLLVRAADGILGTHTLPAARAIQRCASWRSYNTHRPHRALSQRPPDGRTQAAVADDNVRVLRRDRLGGLLHEYSQVT